MRVDEWARLVDLPFLISKTKEMVLEFRRKRPKPDPVSIQGTEVELVSSYKYLVYSWPTSWTGPATWR